MLEPYLGTIDEVKNWHRSKQRRKAYSQEVRRHRLNRSPVPTRLPGGGGRLGIGAGSTCSLSRRPLRVHRFMALMASQLSASRLITSGSRVL